MNATDHPSRPWIVFADDWGRHPSSCQHLVGQLLRHRQIIWINTIGTRPPRLDWSTFQRVINKLGQWTGKKVQTSPNPEIQAPQILAPKMWPSFKSRWSRGINRKLLLRALNPILDSLSMAANVITTLPLVADLVGECRAHRWIYYCVDDFSVWPGYDGDTMLRMEQDLVPKMSELIAVSETLVKHLRKWDREAKLLTHGVDLKHWSHAAEPLPELVAFGEPLIVFWGVIDRRMDLTFLQALNSKLSRCKIVLIGPQEDPDPRLFTLNRVQVLPAMPYGVLPQVAAAASVLVMPYIDAPVTRAMQPLKLKEYLATGKPVVVRTLPSTTPWSDCLDATASADEFAEAVLHRLETGIPEQQRQNRVRLDQEGWAAKAQQFQNWVEG
jgi:glycosyltransferase involved in cell wall biosynthesis